MFEKDLKGVLAESELSVIHSNMALKSSIAIEHCITEMEKSHCIWRPSEHNQAGIFS